MLFFSCFIYRELTEIQAKLDLHFLHVRGKPIIHGSIQPSNILVVLTPSSGHVTSGSHVTLKVTDIALQKHVDPKQALSENFEGNLDFKAPEFWRPVKGKAPRYFTGSDIFSTGLLCLAMIQVQAPHYSLTPRDLINQLNWEEKGKEFGKVMFERNKNNLLLPRLVEDHHADSPLMGRVKVIRIIFHPTD